MTWRKLNANLIIYKRPEKGQIKKIDKEGRVINLEETDLETGVHSQAFTFSIIIKRLLT